MTIRVLIVDDSFVVRSLLEEGLSRHPDLELELAADPIYAMEKMEARWPDVLVLDVEMPRMDGVTFLKRIMSTRPTPVVICSSLAQAGTEVSVRALQAGAFAIVPKARTDLEHFLERAADDLAGIVRAAASSRIDRLALPMPSPAPADWPGARPLGAGGLVAMGASIGGTRALEMILQALPGHCPGIVVVQHMPAPLVETFARNLNRSVTLKVKVAASGDRIERGWVYLAPGDVHLAVQREGSGFTCQLKAGPEVSKHRPSVDFLFRSVAKEAGAKAMGFVLTGMGEDGARGLKEMREAGARTFAQDEDSSVVFGMSKEAIRLGAAERVVSLGEIPAIVAGSTL